MDAAEAALLVDRQRVSIWGASMGGQGAMTIALHHPDTFAVVGSFFGDARFDLDECRRWFAEQGVALTFVAPRPSTPLTLSGRHC